MESMASLSSYVDSSKMTQTEHILSLLTATVFADKRVFSEEINAFLKGAARLDCAITKRKCQKRNYYSGTKRIKLR